MIYFNNDYSEGCHEKVLQALNETNLMQTPGYGTDEYCAMAKERILDVCGDPDLDVHFLVGGTQANLTVIDAALRPHQAALGAVSAHINVHETGAVEATGHKVLSVPSDDGKITAAQIQDVVKNHRASDSFEHEAQPKLVYLSQPTEYGTLYTLSELEEISKTCKALDLYLYVDGARLGYGLAAQDNDVTLPDLARLCDVFYIGGTKVGALFGEAVIIKNPEIRRDFRYLIKQHGGMLAKGRLLGVQFHALFQNDLYFALGDHGVKMANRIRETLDQLKIPYLVPCSTNQIFPIFSDGMLQVLQKEFVFTEMGRVDETHRAVRICTSWATTPYQVEILCERIRQSAIFTAC